MANDLNQWHGIGRVTRAPDVQPNADESKTRASFSVACNSHYNGQDKAEFIPIVCFGRLAVNVGKYLDTGKQCYISGKFQTRKWEKTNGESGYNYKTEILAFQIQFLGNAGDGNGSAGNGAYSRPEANPGAYNTPAAQPAHTAPEDDDLPF